MTTLPKTFSPYIRILKNTPIEQLSRFIGADSGN
jgi:hypothetical protein